MRLEHRDIQRAGAAAAFALATTVAAAAAPLQTAAGAALRGADGRGAAVHTVPGTVSIIPTSIYAYVWKGNKYQSLAFIGRASSSDNNLPYQFGFDNVAHGQEIRGCCAAADPERHPKEIVGAWPFATFTEPYGLLQPGQLVAMKMSAWDWKGNPIGSTATLLLNYPGMSNGVPFISMSGFKSDTYEVSAPYAITAYWSLGSKTTIHIFGIDRNQGPKSPKNKDSLRLTESTGSDPAKIVADGTGNVTVSWTFRHLGSYKFTVQDKQTKQSSSIDVEVTKDGLRP